MHRMAALAAVLLLVKAMPLRPGDRLNVRAPIEDEDSASQWQTIRIFERRQSDIGATR
jgi:hypothetical protein